MNVSLLAFSKVPNTRADFCRFQMNYVSIERELDLIDTALIHVFKASVITSAVLILAAAWYMLGAHRRELFEMSI